MFLPKAGSSTQLCQGPEGDLREHEDQSPESEEADRQGVVLQTFRSRGERRNRLKATHATSREALNKVHLENTV